MKLTYNDIADTTALANEIRKVKLPIRFSLQVAQGLRKARDAFQDFEEVKRGIVEEFGIKQVTESMTDDERKEIEEQNKSVLPQANEAILEALKQEVEIEFKKIKLADFKENELEKLQEVAVNVMEATWWMWEV
jgi:hypothetical protein